MSLLAEAAVGELLGTLSVAVSAMYTLDSGMPRSAAATCKSPHPVSLQCVDQTVLCSDLLQPVTTSSDLAAVASNLLNELCEEEGVHL